VRSARRDGHRSAKSRLRTSDGLGFLSGETIALDGAGQRANGSTFTALRALSAQQWAEIRESPKGATDAHKSLRGPNQAAGDAS